jgi:hypothetical protein
VRIGFALQARAIRLTPLKPTALIVLPIGTTGAVARRHHIV